MFDYNNLKYKYLTESIELAKTKYYNFVLTYQPKNMLGEFNTICIGGIRQSGKQHLLKYLKHIKIFL